MDTPLVIVAPPDLANGSLANRIIVDRLAEMAGVEVRDLQALYPDFKVDVEAEQEALLRADTVVFQFPFFWYGVPGILKQWMDAVLTYGFAYGSTGTKLNGKRLIVSVTVGGPAASYQHGGENTFTMAELLRPLEQTANLTGMRWRPPIITHDMVYIPNVYNVKEEVEQRAREHAACLMDSIAAVDVPASATAT